MKLKFALLQYPITDDRKENARLVLALIHKALKKKPDLIVLPEMSLGGTKVKADAKEWSDFYDAFLAQMRTLCGLKKVSLVFSSLEYSKNKFYNTSHFIGAAGKVLGKYRKIHLFSHGGEHNVFSAGTAPTIVKTPWGKIGLAVCYDIRFPELIRHLAVKGAQLLIVPAQWPSSRREHWLTLLKARAIENQFFVIGVNRLGRKGKDIYGGDSVVFSPWGETLLHGKANRQVLTGNLDLNYLEKIRREYPFFAERKRKSGEFE